MKMTYNNPMAIDEISLYTSEYLDAIRAVMAEGAPTTNYNTIGVMEAVGMKVS